uniref:Swi5-dependent recombination DNA repair protein 1 homolog n=1 Tax=Cyprinus carpio TaxID=7962 RepID=A0A8C2KI27_CYPCA
METTPIKLTPANENTQSTAQAYFHKNIITHCSVVKQNRLSGGEILRKLKMLRMYRKKGKHLFLNQVLPLAPFAQSVLCELQSEIPTEEKQISLAHRIDNLGLDDKKLHFDRTEQDFTDN